MSALDDEIANPVNIPPPAWAQVQAGMRMLSLRTIWHYLAMVWFLPLALAT